DGIGRLLRLPEFQTVDALENLISALDDPGLMEQVTGFARSEEPSIRIGSESAIPALAKNSVICCRYSVSGVPAGGISVIGPTRMDYSHALAALELVREQLETMLNSILK
ncbi:MAG: hypothetical protein J5758_02025, partial [Abditibacteriota bacterium]|nr:hypothetical protein [Abditibacteriota bacterium]